MTLKDTYLHVHLLQSLYPEDILNLAKDQYRNIDWNRFVFLERYQSIIGEALDPPAMIEKALKTGSLKEIEEVMVYRGEEGGDFDIFNIKSFFPLCVTGFYLDKDRHEVVTQPIIDRHKQEGIAYIEYRQGVGYADAVKEAWKDWHKQFIQFLKDVSTDSFQAKYIMRITPESQR